MLQFSPIYFSDSLTKNVFITHYFIDDMKKLSCKFRNLGLLTLKVTFFA
jgi:hypothetical protein